MAPRTVYPRSNDEIRALLKTLGFKKKRGIGRGKHPEKYEHPKRQNQVVSDKPFVIVTHQYFNANGQRLMKKLQNWGFTEEEIKLACQGISPVSRNDRKTETDIDIEPEQA